MLLATDTVTLPAWLTPTQIVGAILLAVLTVVLTSRSNANAAADAEKRRAAEDRLKGIESKHDALASKLTEHIAEDIGFHATIRTKLSLPRDE